MMLDALIFVAGAVTGGIIMYAAIMWTLEQNREMEDGQ